jgi:hypothetical protein
MAIVQMPIVQAKHPIPNGLYLIKNRAADIYWYNDGIKLHFWSIAKTVQVLQGMLTNKPEVNEHSSISQVFKE